MVGDVIESDRQPDYSMYVVMKNAIRDNERSKNQSRYGGAMDTTTMIVDDAPTYSYNPKPVEDGFWNRLQKGLKYIFNDSSPPQNQPVPSSSFNNRNNTVGTTNHFSFNNHNNTIGTTDPDAFSNRNNPISSTYVTSTQRPYGMTTRPMNMYSQPANYPLQTPSKYLFIYL